MLSEKVSVCTQEQCPHQNLATLGLTLDLSLQNCEERDCRHLRPHSEALCHGRPAVSPSSP